MEQNNPPPEEQGMFVRAQVGQYIIVRTEHKANNIGGPTAGAGMA